MENYNSFSETINAVQKPFNRMAEGLEIRLACLLTRHRRLGVKPLMQNKPRTISFQYSGIPIAVTVPTIPRNPLQIDIIPGSIHKSRQDLPDNGDAAGAEGEPNHPTHAGSTINLPLKHSA
jgi:hypothetical protein